MIYGGEPIFKIGLTTFIPYFILFLTLCFISLILIGKIQSKTMRQIIEIHVLIFGIFFVIDALLLDGKPDLMYNIAFTGYSIFLGVLLVK